MFFFGSDKPIFRTPYFNYDTLQGEKFEGESLLKRMNDALNYKLEERCAELTVFLERGARKELQTFFPTLLDNIFGPQGSTTWDLRNVLQEYNAGGYNVVLNFLKPTGPVFRVIYNLLQDPNIKYEFCSLHLPTKIRQMLEGSTVHPYYSEMLKHNNQGRQLISLLLNPFDYYMFHFAYYLINPCHQRLINEELWNSVYYALFTEYLTHFFPLSLNCEITPSVAFYHGKNPFSPGQNLQRLNKQHHLLRTELLKDAQVLTINSMHHNIEKHPRSDIWRSETLLMVFVDLWLTNDQVNYVYGLNLSAPYLELPSSDYIRIIRVAIKHLHAFASLGNADSSALGELRKITLPMIQGKMYVFLRNLVYRWPLDESFRLVLELWLSFIQPWRYANEQFLSSGGVMAGVAFNPSDNMKRVDDDWLPFIAENLLTYVVIFQQLLPRFTRVDLASPKNAHMLFRLTKVFNQTNLSELIKRIEGYLDNRSISPAHLINVTHSLPPLSPTSTWSTNTSCPTSNVHESPRPCHYVQHRHETVLEKYGNLVRQKMFELEGANFCYKPLFLKGVAHEVYELLEMSKRAEIKASQILWHRVQEDKKSSGFFAQLFGHAEAVDKISKLDRQKAPVFLRCSVDNLIEMFEINNFNNYDVTPEMSSVMQQQNTSHNDSYPYVLTPERVKQRLKHLTYDGDPDLMPICSYESKMVVDFLYNACKKINENYGQMIGTLYYNNSLKGRLARLFIQEPKIVYRYEKRDGVSLRVSSHLPPRISLRWFGSRNRLFVIALAFVVASYSGYGTLLILFLLAALGILLCLFKPAPREETGHSEFVMNLNDTLED